MAEKKKRKTVYFNLVRLGYIEEETGIPKRYLFRNLMDKFSKLNNDQVISTIHNGETIIFQSFTNLDFNEKLYHIKILKQREIDLPYNVTKVIIPNEELDNEIEKEAMQEDDLAEELEEVKFNYDTNLKESNIKNDKGTFIGELLNILYDAQNNILIIQSNSNCTTTKGLEKLFTALHYHLFELTKTDYYKIVIAPILKPATVKDMRSLEKITEISYVIEDNFQLRNENGITFNPNALVPQKLEVRQLVNTSPGDKTKSFIKKDVMRVVGDLLRKRGTLKKLEVKGRQDEDSNIEKFDFIKGNLKFNHQFILDTDTSNVLYPDKVINIMKEKYITPLSDGRSIRDIAMTK